jgi:hypothetical protein
MKLLATMLVIAELIYALTAKLAVFMLSLLVIVFASLFTHEMIRTSRMHSASSKRGARP